MKPSSEPGVLRGRRFQPGGAAHRPAVLTLQPDGSLLLDDGLTHQTVSPDALRWSSRLGATPRRATLPDDAVFETLDNDQVDALEHARGRRASTRLHRLENIGPPLLMLAALLMLTFFIGVRWTVPWLADAAARLVPYTVESRIGAATLDTLDRVALRPSKLPQDKQRAILAVFDALAGHAEAPPDSLRLTFRQGGKLLGANALALPGGQIIVTDELAELAHTSEALAGVLAHEIAHVEHRHGMRLLTRIAGLSTIVMLMTGEVSSMTHDIGALGSALLDLEYSRGFELEADTRGSALLRLADMDPETLAALLEKLTSQTRRQAPNWLSTHPPTGERIRLIREQHRSTP